MITEGDERIGISIHAPREGSDRRRYRSLRFHRNFNPRSPRGERPFLPSSRRVALLISIHAPREGSDLVELRGMC